MSGFGFDLSSIVGDVANVTSFSDLGDKLVKLKEDVENSIEASIRHDRFGTPLETDEGTSEQPEPDGTEEAPFEELFYAEGASFMEPATSTEEPPKAETSSSQKPQEKATRKIAPPAAKKSAKQKEEPSTTSSTLTEPAIVKEKDLDTSTDAAPPPQPPPRRKPSPIKKKVVAKPAVEEKSPPASSTTDSSKPKKSADTKVEKVAAAAAASPKTAETAAETTKLSSIDVTSMDQAALCQLVLQLQETLRAREQQIERKSQEHADIQVMMEQLQSKNEELVMAKAKVSEHDLAQIQRDFESKLTTAERKIQALTKERDTYKRQAVKSPDVEALLRERDETIKQVMEEGEILSKKQLTQETQIKQLRARIKNLKDEVADLTGRLETEMGKTAALTLERESVVAEMASLREQHAEELAAERQHHERLMNEARTAQVVAEGKAETAMKAGLAKKLRDSESRAEALEVTVADLRGELERQRAAADEREDMLSSEVSELQRRCTEAEARHQEVQSKLPEATAPLLRQLEAMQEAAASQAAAWAAAERSLQERLAAAENAVAAAEAQHSAAQSSSRHTEARLEEFQKRLDEATARASAAEAAASELIKARELAEKTVARLRSDLAAAQETSTTLEAVYSQQMESLQAREAAAANRVKVLEQQVAGLDGSQPPALAADGLKWVLVKASDEGNNPNPSSSSKDNNNSKESSRANLEGAEIDHERRRSSTDQHGGEQPSNTNGNDSSSSKGGPVLWGNSNGDDEHSLNSISQRPTGALKPSTSTDRQVAALRAQIADLESTRDRLSEELVRTATQAAEAQSVAAKVSTLESALDEVQVRYAAAVELVGERDERLEELLQDIEDMKESYRRQIDVLCAERTREEENNVVASVDTS